MRPSNHNTHFPHAQGGFSFIEILAVLVMISITSAIVWGKFGITAKADLDARTDTLKAHLRYAQARAMDSNLVWGIKSAGAGYSLFAFDGSAETIERLPDEDNTIVNLAGSGIGLGSFAVIAFDSWGSPFANATGTGSSTGQMITVSDGDSHANQITVIKNTGFIP